MMSCAAIGHSPRFARRGHRHCRRLAALARAERHRLHCRDRASSEVERHGERRVEGANRRARRLDADRQRKPRHRDLAARRQRAARRQSSASRPGRRPSCSRRTRAWRVGRPAAATDGTDVLRCRGLRSRQWQAAVGVPARGRGTDARSARQAQHGLAQSRHRRPDGLRLVRHGTDRGARHEREGGLAATSREGDLAVRRRLGSQQLADAVRGHAAAALRSHVGVVSAARSTSAPARRSGRPIEARARSSYSTPLVVPGRQAPRSSSIPASGSMPTTRAPESRSGTREAPTGFLFRRRSFTTASST